MLRGQGKSVVTDRNPDHRLSDKAEQNSDELALLVRVRLGDRQAFATLYGIYHPRLYGYIARLVPAAELVEEVLDDVMFVVWKDSRKFRGDSQLSTWIFGIAYRKSMKVLHKELRRRRRRDDSIDPDDIGAQAAVVDNAVYRALRQLSPEHRQVLVLTYYGGFRYRDIARIAGCPVNTVKTRMFYARRAMKALLENRVQGDSR